MIKQETTRQHQMIRTAETKIKATKTSSDATETTKAKALLRQQLRQEKQHLKQQTMVYLWISSALYSSRKATLNAHTSMHARTRTHDENK